MELDHQILLGAVGVLVVAGLLLPSKKKGRGGDKPLGPCPVSNCPACGHPFAPNGSVYSCTCCGQIYS
ncbi:hypothetical protein PhaeoP24_04053 (plasmid) [Phaeobacter inhibens]|nr:hypothetical protein PhaeoP24_04053 [Phaeobacter inhibens]